MTVDRQPHGREAGRLLGLRQRRADAGDQGFVAAVSTTGISPVEADGNFGATLPPTGSGKEQTVTGNVVLARHHAAGRDCSINGEITFG